MFFLPFPENPVFFFGICSCTRVGLSDIFTVLIWLIASVLITVGPEISAAVSRFFTTSVPFFIGFATRSTFFAFGFLKTIFGWLLFFAGLNPKSVSGRDESESGAFSWRVWSGKEKAAERRRFFDFLLILPPFFTSEDPVVTLFDSGWPILFKPRSKLKRQNKYKNPRKLQKKNECSVTRQTEK